MFIHNEGFKGRCYDSWDTRERREQTSELIELIRLIVGIRTLVTQTVTQNCLRYLFYSMSMGFEVLLSSFHKNVYLSEGLPPTPRKPTLSPLPVYPYRRGPRKTFFQKS